MLRYHCTHHFITTCVLDNDEPATAIAVFHVSGNEGVVVVLDSKWSIPSGPRGTAVTDSCERPICITGVAHDF
jgi:hypothetical protein